MRFVGLGLFLVGVGLAGVFAARPVTVDDADPMARVGAWADVAGVGFGIGAVLMLAGAIVARRERGASVSAGGLHLKDTDRAPALLRQIEEQLAAFPADPTREKDASKAILEEILDELVPRVLDRREALIAQMGLGAFGEMIGHFATMERNVARAWSALIDEAYGEIPGCIERAREGAARARADLEA